MKKTVEENKSFWDEQARLHQGHAVSWWDVNMKKLEINHILPYLQSTDYVLDAGCSNGASTVEIQQAVGCKIEAIDYSSLSIQNVIQHPNITYSVENILDLDKKEVFDKIFSIRCLINLMSQINQQKALLNIYQALKPKGLYIMAEAFWNALQNLNKARSAFDLPSLVEPEYNLYLREEKLEEFIQPYFRIVSVDKYASLYYVGTRIFQYLTLDNDPKKSNTKLHRFFATYGFETKHSGDFSPQKIYVLEKR
jgi:SAM-dependent methyltransferase